MTARLFNGPICQVRNWYVDIRDGTTALTSGDPPGVTNTHSHGTAHRQQHRRLKGHPTKPLKIMAFNMPAVWRLLQAVAVLSCRRDQLVVVWETWEQLKKQQDRPNRTTVGSVTLENTPYGERRVLQSDPSAKTRRSEGPSDSSDYERAAGPSLDGAFTVETGDIYEALRRAKILASEWTQDFVHKIPKGGQDAWNYLVQKRDEGHQHLRAMAAVYRKAANANARKRTDFDALARTAETVKIYMGGVLDVAGALLGHEGAIKGMGIEIGYQFVTEAAIPFAAGDEPDLVGVWKEYVATAAKEDAHTLAEGSEEMKHVYNTLVKIFGEDVAKAALRDQRIAKLLAERAQWIAEHLEKGGVLAQDLKRLLKQAEIAARHSRQTAVKKLALKIALRQHKMFLGLGAALGAARWYYVGHQLHEKLENIHKVWEQPIENEELREDPHEVMSEILDALKKVDVFDGEEKDSQKGREGTEGQE